MNNEENDNKSYRDLGLTLRMFIVIDPFATIFMLPVLLQPFRPTLWGVFVGGIVLSWAMQLAKIPKSQLMRLIARKLGPSLILPSKRQSQRNRKHFAKWPY